MKVGKVVRRLSWGVADQALSSLSNFALTILVARSVTSSNFGAFSLAFATYVLCLNVARSSSSLPLVVRYSGVQVERWRAATREATGMGFTFGALAGVVCIGVAMLTSGALNQTFLALGVSLPGLMIQDVWRSAFYASGRAHLAFAIDFVWAMVMFAVLGALIVVGHPSVFDFTLAWGLGAAAGGTVGIISGRVMFDPWSAIKWIRRHRDLIPNFVGELAITTAGEQTTTYVVAAAAGLSATGSLRAAHVLLRPIGLLFEGVRLVAIPEAVRALKSKTSVATRIVMRSCLLLAGFQFAAFLIWGTAVYLFPSRVGRELLGDVWEPARGVVLMLSIAYASAGLGVGAATGLRVLGAARRSRIARTFASPIQVICVVAGLVVISGAVGAAAGLALGTLISSTVWWWQLGRGLKDWTRSGEAVAGDEPPELPLGAVIQPESHVI